MKKSTKYKHLTYEERVNIEQALDHNESLKDIAKLLKKDSTTLSKEIKRRREEVTPNSYGRSKKYMESLRSCPKTQRFPHVCNGCEQKKGCRLVKYYYRAADAHKEYRYDLSDARRGFDITIEGLNNLANIIKEPLKMGQSFYHIKLNNPEITCCNCQLKNGPQY